MRFLTKSESFCARSRHYTRTRIPSALTAGRLPCYSKFAILRIGSETDAANTGSLFQRRERARSCSGVAAGASGREREVLGELPGANCAAERAWARIEAAGGRFSAGTEFMNCGPSRGTFSIA